MKLRYTNPALSELDEVLDYIALRSPQGAPTNDPRIRRIGAHPFPYLIFYEVTAAEVIIHAVRHGARDPTDMPGAK